MKQKLSVALGAVFLICFIGWTGYSQRTQTARNSWEYLLIQDDRYHQDESIRKINELGTQGWELVGVSDETVNEGNQTFSRLYFKRAR